MVSNEKSGLAKSYGASACVRGWKDGSLDQQVSWNAGGKVVKFSQANTKDIKCQTIYQSNSQLSPEFSVSPCRGAVGTWRLSRDARAVSKIFGEMEASTFSFGPGNDCNEDGGGEVWEKARGGLREGVAGRLELGVLRIQSFNEGGCSSPT